MIYHILLTISQYIVGDHTLITLYSSLVGKLTEKSSLLLIIQESFWNIFIGSDILF
jgi:hypothetical protein